MPGTSPKLLPTQLADLRAAAREARASVDVSLLWISRYQDGDDFAARVLLTAHRPMLAKITARFCRETSRDWEDCLQQAKMGFLVGAQRFAVIHSKGTLAYLWMWTRHHIQRWLMDCGQVVRIPVHKFDHGQINRATFWRSWTILSCELPEQMHDGIVRSFEEELVDDAELADELFSDEERQIVVKRVARWLLPRLDSREALILFDRFKENPRKLEDIGQDLGISRERVRQLETIGLESCRKLLGFKVGHPDISFDEWLSLALRRVETDTPEPKRLTTSARSGTTKSHRKGGTTMTRLNALKKVDPDAWEKQIRAAMKKAKGRVSDAAALLECSTRSLFRALEELPDIPRAAYGLPRDGKRGRRKKPEPTIRVISKGAR